jgi:UDP-N-acetylmuramyl pentapeptide phosphotransferase/UDP-N-acetylglucosamine-1-phosphate transferase
MKYIFWAVGIFAFSFLINIIVLIISKKTNTFMDCAKSDKPQRLHKKNTPRVGGISVFGASLALAAFPHGYIFIVCGVFAFAAGLVEDFTGKLNPFVRLAAITVSGLIAIFVFDVYIENFNVIQLPYAATVIFCLFGLVGVSNSINIIDGLNGLASGTAIISFISFGAASCLAGDTEFSVYMLILMSATMGFFVFVFPKGKIFLGDGGAYYLGFLLGFSSLLLVLRNGDNISSWFPLASLIYPIWEVVFSVYRRKVIKRTSAFHPDRLHMHTLMYKRTGFSNSGISTILIVLNSLFQIPLLYFRNNTPVLIGIVILFICAYYYFYRKILKFRFKSTAQCQLKPEE